MSARTQIRAETRLRPADLVRCRRFDDELVVLDLRQGQYYALNDSGARMWDLLAAGRTPREVADELTREFDARAEDVLRDCMELAGDLLERHLVDVVDS